MPTRSVLLDECVDRKLAKDLAPHRVTTVPRMGWSGKKNGVLLRLVSGRFDVFVTTDTKLAFQQNVSGFEFCVIVLQSHSNKLVDLKPLVPRLLHAIDHPTAGRVVVLRRSA